MAPNPDDCHPNCFRRHSEVFVQGWGGGHGQGPNTNMANGLGNPTASLIEGCSPDVQREKPIRNSEGGRAAAGIRFNSHLEKQGRGEGGEALRCECGGEVGVCIGTAKANHDVP